LVAQLIILVPYILNFNHSTLD